MRSERKLIGRRWPSMLGWLAPAALGLGVAMVLALGAAADPARGVTTSGSPFADEAFNAVNARNLVLLGRWSTDSWNLYLVDLPFSALLAAAFKLLGVGIVQARLVSIATIGVMVALIGWGLRRPFGTAAASLAALAVGTSGLLLYYGRLVYQENLVALFLMAGVLTLATEPSAAPWRRGLLAGALLALAIGTKPSALFAVAGLLVGVALVDARSGGTRRWLLATLAVIAAAGIAWVVTVLVPERSQVLDVMKIWPQFNWPTDPGSLARRVLGYLASNDRALALSLPLATAGTLGLVVIARRRRALEGSARLLVAAAAGWLIAGLGILSVASYRPNRYVVPLLPAAAILMAAGISLALPSIRARLAPTVRALAAAAAVLVIATPGLAAHATWVVGAPSTAPAIQAQMARVVPAGSVVVGVDSALFLMRAPVVTVITWKGVPGNSGDLYHSAGARWYLTNRDVPPYANSLPPGAWAARREVACATWFGARDCLYQVP